MFSRIAAIALLLCAASLVCAETPLDQTEAIDRLKGIPSNLQMNRDGTVRFVRFSKSIVTDEHVAQTVAFQQLGYLAVVTLSVTDAGLAHVGQLTNLDTLFLSDSGVTDTTLCRLAPLLKLERLYLDRTNVVLWDTTSGQESSAFTIQAPEAVVKFSADLKRLAAPIGLTVKTWSMATGQETLTMRGHTARVWGVAFDPTGEQLASASADGSIRVWDTTTGQATFVLKGHDGDFTSSDQDREELGYMIGQDDLLKGRNALGVLAVDFSADGKRLISAGWDRTIKVWDATRNQEAITLEGHGQNQAVQTLAFNADGTRLVSGSGQVPLGGTGIVKNWSTVVGKELQTRHAPAGQDVKRVAYSPDGKLLAMAYFYEIVVADAATGREHFTLKGLASVDAVSFNSDGTRLVAAAGGSIVLCDASTGREVRKSTSEGEIKVVAFSPDGRQLAFASKDGIVKVWDAGRGRQITTLAGPGSEVTSLVFSVDGSRLASGGSDGAVKLWDAVTGQESASVKGHGGRVTSVAFSPDGKRIASGSLDQTVKLWDTESGQEVLTIKGHTNMVTCVAFDSDGNQIASGDWGGTIKVWSGGHEFTR